MESITKYLAFKEGREKIEAVNLKRHSLAALKKLRVSYLCDFDCDFDNSLVALIKQSIAIFFIINLRACYRIRRSIILKEEINQNL